MKRFNRWLALKVTAGVSTMVCAYLFALLAIIGFPINHPTPQQYVQWLSQTFIQLTMLSVIMVGQNLQNQKHDETNRALKKIHQHLKIKE